MSPKVFTVWHKTFVSPQTNVRNLLHSNYCGKTTQQFPIDGDLRDRHEVMMHEIAANQAGAEGRVSVALCCPGVLLAIMGVPGRTHRYFILTICKRIFQSCEVIVDRDGFCKARMKHYRLKNSFKNNKSIPMIGERKSSNSDSVAAHSLFVLTRASRLPFIYIHTLQMATGGWR